jgi:glutathione-specific gamma-glutamylcyclotransferase
MLTRADLESDRLRKLFRRANPDARVLSDAELESSLQSLLQSHPEGEDVWLFGYGSLIWNPILHFEERHVGRLHGYHRRFCLWSHVGRGSLRKPGLVLGLDAGGSCRGVVYRIRADQAQSELRLLWRREMVLGSYRPRWLRVSTGERDLTAIAFVVNRDHHSYAGRLPLETVLKTMVGTRGFLGTPAEYLIETIRGLLAHGVRDEYLMEIRKRVLALRPDLAHPR